MGKRDRLQVEGPDSSARGVRPMTGPRIASDPQMMEGGYPRQIAKAPCGIGRAPGLQGHRVGRDPCKLMVVPFNMQG